MKPQNKRFIPDIRPGSPGMSIYDLRTTAKADPAAFVHKVHDLVAAGKIRLSQIRDIRSLYQGLADVRVPITVDMMGAQRAMSASAFPILVGAAIIAAINEAYLQYPAIGQELVSEMEDSKKVTSIAAIHSLDVNVDEVKELDEFPEIGAKEEKVEIRHRRNGRRLTISAEMVEENETADIVQRVNALGMIAADWVEELTLDRVYDKFGSKASPSEPYVYRPEGTGTALYSATANTPGTRAPSGNRINSNALVDETDLDAARTRLASMKNERGKRINIPYSERKLILPDALMPTALKILNSELVPGVVNEVSNWGPRGKFNIPVERVVSSPKLDDISTGCWHYGAPQMQFVRKWKLRFEYVTLGEDTESYLRSRIAFQARIAWDCEIGSTDYVYVVECLAATTAPGDE